MALDPHSRFQRIRLNRKVDVSGVSGTGIVAYGVIWPDGSVTLRWDTQVRSTVMYDSLNDVHIITSHGGNTVIEYIDRIEHRVVIDERGWVIEHSDDCRLAERMANCFYSQWARDHLDGSRRYPTGTFVMIDEDDGYMALEPVR